MEIDAKHLQQQIDELALISENPPPVVTRVLFSEADLRGREFVRKLCLEAGLALREDAVGNLFARWPGKNQALPPVATGSHIDAIPNAGRYDGVVGVLGALAAIRALRRDGFAPARSIELIVFTAEEPTRFGIGCLGSRLMSGVLSPEKAAALQDREGVSLVQWLQKFYGSRMRNIQPSTSNTERSIPETPSDRLDVECSMLKVGGFQAMEGAPERRVKDLSSVRLAPGCYSAFVELHIEQGPLLEREGLPIGVVEKIAAPSTLRLQLTGEGGHAGAVLMPDRHDALLAGAEIALAVERVARRSGSPDTVGTTGVFRIEPGAVNSVPCRAGLEIDLRDTQPATRDAALAQIEQATEEICRRRGIQWHLEKLNVDPPGLCDPRLVSTVADVCARLKLPVKRMISRAYHDSLFLAQLCPTTMIFIPCRDGVSHRPDEYSSPEEIRAGVMALAGTLARLASEE
jgi:N-carbamoyl-L-amino-acid hydrolase